MNAAGPLLSSALGAAVAGDRRSRTQGAPPQTLVSYARRVAPSTRAGAPPLPAGRLRVYVLPARPLWPGWASHLGRSCVCTERLHRIMAFTHFGDGVFHGGKHSQAQASQAQAPREVHRNLRHVKPLSQTQRCPVGGAWGGRVGTPQNWNAGLRRSRGTCCGEAPAPPLAARPLRRHPRDSRPARDSRAARSSWSGSSPGRCVWRP